VETPRTTSNTTIPSTRETIDLISDEEGDTVIKKKEPSLSPSNIPSIPTSVATRKRVKMGDIQDETPSRPPLKKQKSPTGEALPTPRSAPPQPQAPAAIIPPRILSPQPDPFADSTFTQIPDSEGEDNDDICFEDLNSDDIPLETKEFLAGTSSVPDRSVDVADRDDNTVPESPMKDGNGGEYENNVNNRVYPTIPSGDNVTMNPRNSFGTSTSTLSLVPQLEIKLIADDTAEFTSKDSRPSQSQNENPQRIDRSTSWPNLINRSSWSSQRTTGSS
jgi:hypothetical protein